MFITVSYQNLDILVEALDHVNAELLLEIERLQGTYETFPSAVPIQRWRDLDQMRKRLREREDLYFDMHELLMQGAEGILYTLNLPSET